MEEGNDEGTPDKSPGRVARGYIISADLEMRNLQDPPPVQEREVQGPWSHSPPASPLYHVQLTPFDPLLLPEQHHAIVYGSGEQPAIVPGCGSSCLLRGREY